ncbi:hypothetical protein K0M31_009146, partial [Melipona bicolor]
MLVSDCNLVQARLRRRCTVCQNESPAVTEVTASRENSTTVRFRFTERSAARNNVCTRVSTSGRRLPPQQNGVLGGLAPELIASLFCQDDVFGARAFASVFAEGSDPLQRLKERATSWEQ